MLTLEEYAAAKKQYANDPRWKDTVPLIETKLEIRLQAWPHLADFFLGALKHYDNVFKNVGGA